MRGVARLAGAGSSGGKDELLRKEKFNPEGLKDVIWAGMFVLHVLAVMIWIGYAAASGLLTEAINSLSADNTASLLQGKSGPSATPMQSSILVLLVGLGCAFVYACIWMSLLQAYPIAMAYGSLYLCIALFTILGVVLLGGGNIGGLILLIFALLIALMIYCMRSRIEFTAKCLKAVSSVYSVQPSIFLVAVLVLFLQVIWQITCVLSFLPVTAAIDADQKRADAAPDDEDTESSPYGGLLLLQMFSFYWGAQVLSNILHVSCCGVVARWYFDKQVDIAVSKSTGQAFTSYLGPIALGSFLIAIIQTLEFLVRSIADNRGGNQSAGQRIAAEIAICILRCVERLVEIFNTFAFVIVSIYGVTYCEAGTEALNLLARQGCKVLSGYNLVSLICFIGCFMGGVIVACINSVLAASMMLPGGFIGGVAVFGFVTSYFIMTVVARVVESGCDTLFICFAEEPQKLKSSNAEIFEAFSEQKRIS